jgi:phage major head subunit gpT-like protein
MGSEFDLLSRDAQNHLTEYASDFAVALSQTGIEQWAKALGLSRTSKAQFTKFPIPLSAAGYEEFKGDVKYRTLSEKSLEIKSKTWQDGVAELASVIEAPDFIGWLNEPAAMAASADALPNEIIAGLLEANGTHALDSLSFFNAAHPFNVLDTSVGTFDNDFTGGTTLFTVSNLSIAKQAFRAMKSANGKSLGLKLTHILFPSAMEEEVKDILEMDMRIQSNGANDFGVVNNRHKGTVTPIFSDELTSDIIWYPLALNKPGLYPWIYQTDGQIEEIVSDKSSHLYATTLKVGVAHILRGNGALALPHAVQRWAGTA